MNEHVIIILSIIVALMIGYISVALAIHDDVQEIANTLDEYSIILENE